MLNEYADMHIIYGVIEQSRRWAVKVYGERYPNSRKPHHQMFACVNQQLRETWQLTSTFQNSGGNGSTQTVLIEDANLKSVEEPAQKVLLSD